MRIFVNKGAFALFRLEVNAQTTTVLILLALKTLF